MPNDALPFGVGGPAEEAVGPPKLVGNLAGAILGIPKHLIEASANAVPGLRREDYTDNPNAPQPNQPMYNAAADTAMALAGMGAPAAEAGAAGIFGGKLAKTADLKALNEAKLMASHGLHPADVLRDTSWFRSPADHQWRFEIPDNKLSLNYFPDREAARASSSMEGLVNHPELYKAYPELRNFKTSLTKDTSVPEGNGLWINNEHTAHVVAPDPALGRSIMGHELQHGIQQIEGFSPGNNPSYYAYQIEQGLRKKPEIGSGYDFETIKNQAHDLYHRTSGEVEARNVQHRMDFTPQERVIVPPWASQDVPYLNQLKFDPKTETVTALRDLRK